MDRDRWIDQTICRSTNEKQAKLTSSRWYVKAAVIRRAIIIKQITQRYVNTAIFICFLVRVNLFYAIPPEIISFHFNAASIRGSNLERTPVPPLSRVTTQLCHFKKYISFSRNVMKNVLEAPGLKAPVRPRVPPVPREPSPIQPSLPSSARTSNTPIPSHFSVVPVTEAYVFLKISPRKTLIQGTSSIAVLDPPKISSHYTSVSVLFVEVVHSK